MEFIPDGDYGDAEKWDFSEDKIPIYWIDNYPYKATTEKNAKKLFQIRKQIDILCDNLIKNRIYWESESNQQYLDGVDIFLGLHKEALYSPYVLPSPFFERARMGLYTSRYLLSEIPKKTKFDGLNKPKTRYFDKKHSLPKVGKDGSKRALYRDIFLNLNKNDDDLKSLVVHELAHSMANHIFYRPNDHHSDFNWAEKMIKKYWPK